MDWENCTRQLQACLDAVSQLGGETSMLHVSAPVTESEIKSVEADLNIALPKSMRQFLLEHGGSIDLDWYLPDGYAMPEKLKEAQFGGFHWSLSDLVYAEGLRRYVVDEVLSTRGDPIFERGWDGALAFSQIANGDFLAVDLRDPERAPVVILDHDEDCIRDEELGKDFQDFMTRWSALGFPGPESWVLEPFLASPKGPLDPEGENARLWRKTIGFAPSD